jgi:hypothetical protein
MDQQAAWNRQLANNANASGFPAALVRCYFHIFMYNANGAVMTLCAH